MFTADTFNDPSTLGAEALRDDAENRYVQRIIESQRKARAELTPEDRYLVLPELKLFKPGAHGKTFFGCRAWDELASFLCAVAVMDEVTRVAPAFRDHLEAAVECLGPFLREAAAREDDPDFAPLPACELKHAKFPDALLAQGTLPPPPPWHESPLAQYANLSLRKLPK
jgi:hypothetical protein